MVSCRRSAESDAPHSGQNLFASTRAALQKAHVRVANALPHSLQKRCPSGLSLPQDRHCNERHPDCWTAGVLAGESGNHPALRYAGRCLTVKHAWRPNGRSLGRLCQRSPRLATARHRRITSRRLDRAYVLRRSPGAEGAEMKRAGGSRRVRPPHRVPHGGAPPYLLGGRSVPHIGAPVNENSVRGDSMPPQRPRSRPAPARNRDRDRSLKPTPRGPMPALLGTGIRGATAAATRGGRGHGSVTVGVRGSLTRSRS